ncbi:2-nitropropane dioxygenase [Leucogyrophana mollusca]|uniref:2-nitropropane dioxygenase n=1 Tax=Leucogyrophana mollusca TaxID=85980 RepID=A0ACB8BKP4_9AGAM|nr:2-nitropropane dioxygenase [Leucogyrophana mollusca]
MSRINTALTRLLGINTPVISAPMAGASGGKLAGEVSAGGGFGFIGASYRTVQQLQEELLLARSVLQLQNEPTASLPIGAGYIVWQLEKVGKEVLSVALEQRVQAVWFAFGDNIGSWVRYVREYDSQPGRNHKTLVFVQVGSVEDALVAMTDWKVDVIVAQGNEAGGHGFASSPPLLTLVPSILAVVPKNGPLVIAAGGLSGGNHVASILALGAAGVVLGTRFLLTPESQYQDVQKKAIIAAKANSTVRTMTFDRVRGTLGWPEGVDGRALYNDTVKDLDAGVDFQVVKEKFDDGVRREDPDRFLAWAGTGASLMSEIKGAKDIVRELHDDAIANLKAASELISDK